ncbi:MAG: flagellar motor protein MotB [Planctomycetota bacterium]
MKSRIILAAVCSFTSACISQGQYDKVSGENLYLGRQVQSQQQEIDRLRNELNLMRSISDTHQEVESINSRWINDLEAKVKDLEGLKFSVNERGEGTLQIANTLLFNPGEITVSPQGRKSLSDLAVQLKTAPGTLRIDGHTDNQPIKNPATLSHSKDNWQLSCNRSLAVLRVLLDNGVPPEKISVAGYAMYRPVADNGKKGSNANRRVDIVFLPESKAVAPAAVAQPKASEKAMEQAPVKTEEESSAKPSDDGQPSSSSGEEGVEDSGQTDSSDDSKDTTPTE